MSKFKVTIDSVQMMRGFAAILVALFHFSQMLSSRGGDSPVEFVSNGGYAGVDVFFVISGYIMALTSQKLRSGIKPAFLFFSKRILRIFGGWIPVFLILSVAYFLLSPNKLADANLVKSLFLIPQPHAENILAVTWSLSYELYFYVMLSLLLLIFKRRTVYAILLYAAIIFVMRFSVEILGLRQSFFKYIAYSHDYPNVMLSAFTLEFLAGFVLYWLPRRLSISLALWLAILGMLTFASGMTYIKYALDGGYVGGNLLRAFFFGFSSLLIIAGLVKLEMSKHIRIPRFFVFLGNASFTIYLLHIPIFLAFFAIIIKIGEWTSFPFFEYSGIMTIGALMSLLILSSLHYYFVENPIHNRIRLLIRKFETKK